MSREERWRVLGNSQTTLIGVSLRRSCEWEGARSAVAVTAALWQRPGNLCVCVYVHRYARLHRCMAHYAFVMMSLCVFLFGNVLTYCVLIGL